ncbi:PTS sugar transporter subunit IIA [Companilactobacillus zhachilii]|uniref:PTS sugar transporter subunit IIA n=2 Tax=Companilactobacillus zhachilii TaxID=2304606 RepID=A0A386PQG4_9LACO|nr:PTS sugar transporter subunit IIA [Companilactobacillus zhachilii]
MLSMKRREVDFMSFWQKIGDFLSPSGGSQSIKTNDQNVTGPQKDPMSDFSQVLKVENIAVDVEVKSREELLKYLSKFAQTIDNGIDAEAIYGKYLVRENDAATDLGDQIAVPHAQDKSVEQLMMLIVKLKQPIIWDKDKQVQIVLSLVIPDPEKNYQHVPYLSSIARLLLKKGFLHALNRSRTSEEVFKLFVK